MKLDPSMHIGLHLFFFGKIGVTSEPASLRELGPASPVEVPAHTTSLPGGKTSALAFSTGPELHVGLLRGRLV
jgi:hypothetical protein